MGLSWKTFAVMAIAVAGCSAAHTGNSDPTRISNPGAAPAGAAGASSSASSQPAGGFGNGTAPPATLPAVLNDAGGVPVSDGSTCVIGKFCASSNVDMGCGMITFGSTVKMVKKPGNVLLVWDRSTSMMQDWNGMVRWQAAGSALIAALMPLADDLKIGGIFFPSVVSSGKQRDALAGTFSCDVDAYDAPGQIPFMPGAQFLQALQKADPSGMVTPIYAAGSAQATPTYAALAQADKAIQNATLQGTLAVVLITDGEPTCTDWDQNAATALAANWLTLYHAQTYVVGLPSTDIQANGKAVLNALAQAGGTGQFIDPSNATTLQQMLNQIVSSTISSGFDSCAIDLMPPTNVPDKLQLVVEETSMPGKQESVPHDLGWTVSADGSHVDLSGGLCDAAKSGQFTKLTFTFGCNSIPPLPPDHVH